jgi:uncharacterized membrane protein
VDCYFHHAVPSVARCCDCGKPICASCRAAEGDCPSCRLAARVDAAAAERRRLAGVVGPSWRPPQVEPLRPESRALAALGYPFWPLALLALFEPARTPFVRRNAWQALGFNAGMYGIGWLLASIAAIPLVGISAWPLLPFIVPVTVVASVVYAIKAWHGEDVRIPFVSDAVDQRIGAR